MYMYIQWNIRFSQTRNYMQYINILALSNVVCCLALFIRRVMWLLKGPHFPNILQESCKYLWQVNLAVPFYGVVMCIHYQIVLLVYMQLLLKSTLFMLSYFCFSPFSTPCSTTVTSVTSGWKTISMSLIGTGNVAVNVNTKTWWTGAAVPRMTSCHKTQTESWSVHCTEACLNSHTSQPPFPSNL